MVVRVSHKVLLELAVVGGEGDGKVLLVDWVHEYAAKNKPVPCDSGSCKVRSGEEG